MTRPRSRAALPPGTRVVEADLRDPNHVDRALAAANPELLVHLAWHTDAATYLTDTANLRDLQGSTDLFLRARARGCRRIVGIGTCLEYEQSSAPLREDHPLRPATVYGAAKAALYLAVSAWAQQTETEFAWLRLFHLYGPREDPRRLVANVMTSLLAGQRIATTAGDQLRDYLHVDDVGDAIAAVALSTICGEVNVGSGQPVAVRDLVATIGEAVGRADLIDVGARAPRPGDPPSLVADVTRLSTDVGWTPRLALRDGIKQTLEWWRVQHAKEPSSILVRDEF